ncbi:potassium voltage-gated channel subfamily H member 2 isoform X2 [Hermetia illucens]|uniref:potassium voltage-gated channel subfamily H member 2 isoform X2 n=1 Tax=Hermetia illucens TaxID=343691 RepID=UPI0018CC0511|nr:potassium voltage-gated channel subfamily H member 2 isoform X2 [Hermetia illucens]
MPVRRGHVAPKTTLIETIIKKFDTHNRSFLVANAQSETFHIIWCSDGFCKMTGYTRADVMQRSSCTEFLHGPMTSQTAVNQIREALTKGVEKHFEILYYRKDGEKFLCSEVIAPIRSEADDISLYIINFEDLTNPPEEPPPVEERISKFDRARASFRQSFKFGSLRERGLRLAGYLTPPSDATQEEEEAHENQATLPKIESGKVWSPMATPTLRSKETEKIRDSLRLEDLKVVVPDKPVPEEKKPEFVHTKSLDFDNQTKDEEQNLLRITENSVPLPNSTRGLQQMRAHTVDDFMKGYITENVDERRDNNRSTGQTSRQFFPYVSSESDLQRYKAISFRHNSCTNEQHQRTASSSLSNVPSDLKSDRIKDNGSAKFFQGTRHTPNMGEKVAQATEKWSSVRLSTDSKTKVKIENHISVNSNLNLNGFGNEPKTKTAANLGKEVLSLGADVLPEYKMQSPSVHKWTILHYSPFKAVWDWIILILVMYTAIFTPYVAAFLLGEPDYNQRRNNKYLNSDPIVIIDLIVDVTFVIDILINFRTTFVNGQDEVVSHPGRIAVHYLSGWFLIDLVAAIPFDLLLVGSDTDELGLDKDETTTLIGLLKTARLLRLVRVARKIDRYSEYGAAVLVLLMATFALIAHWLACIWYAIGNAERPILRNKIGWLDILANDTQEFYLPNNTGGPSIKSRYITALYFTFTSLTSVGFGNVAPNTDAEKIFTICVMLVGSLMYASIFGNVSAIIQRLYSGTARYHTQMLRVREFIRFHQIPNPLRQRLEEYFQHAWTYTNGIDMNSVLKGFPECLQADICLHLNRNLLTNCSAFEGASPGCLRALSLKFKTTHAPPGDTLVHKGDVLTSLYFIARGSIEILKDDVVMVILGKDDIFGENPCIYSTIGKSNSNVRALTYCDLHKIHREDLLDVLDLYPEFYDSFVNNLVITYNMRDEEQAGVEIRQRFMRASSHERERSNSDTRSVRLSGIHTRPRSICDNPNDRLTPDHMCDLDKDGGMSDQQRGNRAGSLTDSHSHLHKHRTSIVASSGGGIGFTGGGAGAGETSAAGLETGQLLADEYQEPKETDAVTLSATTTNSCFCGPKEMGGSRKPYITDLGAEKCVHSSHCVKTSELSSIKEQLGKLAQRIDTLETNLHKDIRTILDILHQQQQMQLQLHQQQMQHQLLHQQQLQQHQQQYATGKQIATPYQPSESDFSFDLCGVADKSLTHLQQQQQPQRINVQRSVSQPECAASNEKSLFRCSKFSSFNQTMEDTDNWTVFAPIAKLESLDEIDQDSRHSNTQDTQ